MQLRLFNDARSLSLSPSFAHPIIFKGKYKAHVGGSAKLEGWKMDCCSSEKWAKLFRHMAEDGEN